MAKKAKSPVSKKNPRLLHRGDVLRSKQSGTDEVVRSVSMVVHLANGTDEIYELYPEPEEVQVVTDPEPVVELEGE